MALLLKNVRAIDPQVALDEVCDIVIRDGKIAEVGQNLSIEKGETRDMGGKIAVPGLVDVHVHLREPGFEQKEDIASGTRAAAHGGFTAVCCMANTNPVIDNALGVEYILARAAAVGKCRVHVAGAATQGLKGEIISEMGDMVAHGAVAFTDDGRGIQGAGMMRRVMDYASQFDRVVMAHEQDDDLVGEGQVNEGVVSTRLGMLGWPAEGEEIQIARDIALSRLTGCPLHVQHISTARGLEMIRAAKAEGLKVTCEATPHHLFLNEDAIGDDYNTSLKVNPPLRTQEDSDALLAGVIDGTIDCIVTDHAPHTAWEKDREFELSPFGMIGLETSLSLVMTQMVHTGLIDYNRLVEVMAINPRKVLRVEEVKLQAGSTADITIIDPDLEWTVTADSFVSKAKNSGFIGADLKGRAT
ncbi:MAG: dihydroorotase, partial [Eggerthellaceae bacterium]